MVPKAAVFSTYFVPNLINEMNYLNMRIHYTRLEQ